MPGYELIGDEELDQVKSVFDSGGILFRHGFEALRNNSYKVRDFENAFALAHSIPHALAVTSGTAALRVALASIGIKQGDEVITQAFTFVATVEAIIESGATPICGNIDKTLNLDPSELESLITPRTKAVIVVHMLGTPAHMRKIKNICDRHKIVLIEDTAWGCGESYQGIPLGTFGDIGTFSFDFAKTITTGEGGMVIFKDEKLYKRACAWHDHGHENNPNVPRWEDTRSSSGFNFRMMELQGAIGLAQLAKLPQIVEMQRRNRDLILNQISCIDEIEIRQVPDESFDTADALVFFMSDPSSAKRCRTSLLKFGLGTKILPEAYTWHFAATWDHMPELVKAHKTPLSDCFSESKALLSRAVSIPISIKQAPNAPLLVYDAIKDTIANK